jgi:hypothetical protein
MRLALVLVVSLLASPAHAAAITFTGTLDGAEMVVELTQPVDGAVAGRYTLVGNGGDVPLVPVSHDDGVWVLSEEAPCGEDDCTLDDNGDVLEAPVAATWELRYDPSIYLATGTRTPAEGKAKPQPLKLDVVAWRPLGADEEPTAFGLHDRSAALSYSHDRPLDWTDTPYEMSVLDVPLEQGEVRDIDGSQYRYVIDPRTRFEFPRAVAMSDGSPVDAANRVLADRHYRMNLSAFECLAMVYASYGVDSEWSIRGGHLAEYDGETVELSYLSPTIVSWYQSGSLYCTGAHPYNHIDSYTYDLDTGEELDLSRIFSAWVPRTWGAAPDDIVDAETAAADPDSINWGPSPELIAYVRENLPEEMLTGDAELDEICYGEQALADQLDLRFSAGPSVIFTASGFPHVSSVCNGDLFEVPLSDLTAFLSPTAREYFAELEP